MPLLGKSAGDDFPALETLTQGIVERYAQDPSHLTSLPPFSADMMSGRTVEAVSLTFSTDKTEEMTYGTLACIHPPGLKSWP